MLLKWEIPYETRNLNKGTVPSWNTREYFVSPWKAACDRLLVRNFLHFENLGVSRPRGSNCHLQRFHRGRTDCKTLAKEGALTLR